MDIESQQEYTCKNQQLLTCVGGCVLFVLFSANLVHMMFFSC